MRQQNPEFFKPDIDVHKVKRIEFGILNPEDVAKMAVVKVTERNVYEQPSGEAKRGGKWRDVMSIIGLNDPAMGPIGTRDECMTCKGSNEYKDLHAHSKHSMSWSLRLYRISEASVPCWIYR